MSKAFFSASAVSRGLLRFYRSRSPLARTLLDFVFLVVAHVIISLAFSFFVEPRAVPPERQHVDNFAWFFIQAIVFAPVWEELVFRGIPLILYDIWQSRFSFWLLGLLSAFLFASGHTPTVLPWPVTQFLGGLLLWWVATDRGLRYAMLPHSLINLSAVSLYWFSMNLVGERL